MAESLMFEPVIVSFPFVPLELSFLSGEGLSLSSNEPDAIRSLEQGVRNVTSGGYSRLISHVDGACVTDEGYIIAGRKIYAGEVKDYNVYTFDGDTTNERVWIIDAFEGIEPEKGLSYTRWQSKREWTSIDTRTGDPPRSNDVYRPEGTFQFNPHEYRDILVDIMGNNLKRDGPLRPEAKQMLEYLAIGLIGRPSA